MGKVWDYDLDCEALCPLTGEACVMECMLMRPTALGEPRCSLRVAADELVNIHICLRDNTERSAM